MSENKHHSGTAAVLSFVFSGLGQLYNGQITKGLIIIFFTVVNLLINVLGAVLIYIWLTQKLIIQTLWAGITLLIVGLISICIIGIHSIVDAYEESKKQ